MPLPDAFGSLFQGYLKGRDYAQSQQEKLKAEERASLHNRAGTLLKLMEQTPAVEAKEALHHSLMETLDAIDADGKRGAKQKPGGLGSMFRGFFGIEPQAPPSHPLQSIADVMKEAERQRQAKASAAGAMGSVSGAKGVPALTPQGPAAGPSPIGGDHGLNLGAAVNEQAPSSPVMSPAARAYTGQQGISPVSPVPQHERLGDPELRGNFPPRPAVATPPRPASTSMPFRYGGDPEPRRVEDTPESAYLSTANGGMAVPGEIPYMDEGEQSSNIELPRRSPIVENFLQAQRSATDSIYMQSPDRPSPMAPHDHRAELDQIRQQNTGFMGYQNEGAIKQQTGAVDAAHKAEKEIYGQELDNWVRTVEKRVADFVVKQPDRSLNTLMTKYPGLAETMTELQSLDPKAFDAFRRSGIFSDYQGEGFQKPDPKAALEAQVLTEGRAAGRSGLNIMGDMNRVNAPLDQQRKDAVRSELRKKGWSEDEANRHIEAQDTLEHAAADEMARSLRITLAEALGRIAKSKQTMTPNEAIFSQYMNLNGGDPIRAHAAMKAADTGPKDSIKERKDELAELKIAEYVKSGMQPAQAITSALKYVDGITDKQQLDLREITSGNGNVYWGYINRDNGSVMLTKALSPSQPDLGRYVKSVNGTVDIGPGGLKEAVIMKTYDAEQIIADVQTGLLSGEKALGMAKSLRLKDDNSADAGRIEAAVTNRGAQGSQPAPAR